MQARQRALSHVARAVRVILTISGMRPVLRSAWEQGHFAAILTTACSTCRCAQAQARRALQLLAAAV
jgi:hypothetical protein